MKYFMEKTKWKYFLKCNGLYFKSATDFVSVILLCGILFFSCSSCSKPSGISCSPCMAVEYTFSYVDMNNGTIKRTSTEMVVVQPESQVLKQIM